MTHLQLSYVAEACALFSASCLVISKLWRNYRRKERQRRAKAFYRREWGMERL